jgi:hypothetical protein
MQLKIISWNIRHFRKSKIEDYIHTLWEVCGWAHVCFIYEDHAGVGGLFATHLNNYEKKQSRQLSNWSGVEIRTHDEYVAVIWRTPVTVAHNSGRQAQFSKLISGEREPAVVDVNAGTGRTLTVAAWHAFGPAKVSAKDLFQSIQKTDFCDVLIGDFNFQTFNKDLGTGGLVVDQSEFELGNSMDFAVADSTGLVAASSVGKRSSRIMDTIKMQEILPSNHSGSTTYTEMGQGRRTTGLDRCLVSQQHVASVQLNVAMPKEFDEMSTLTDHMPLMLIFEVS